MSDVFGIGKAVERLMDPVNELVKKLAGPAAEEVGLSLQDSVKVWRARRQYRLFEKMNSFMQDAGFEPKPVTLKVLLPALDWASVEDDEDLHSTWAALLSNAADPRQTSPILPSFPTILKDLTSGDVKFLDALVREAEQISRNASICPPLSSLEFDHWTLQNVFDSAGLGRPVADLLSGAPQAADWRDDEALTVSLTMDVLYRNALISKNYFSDNSSEQPFGMVVTKSISLTDLAVRFVVACRRPLKT